MGRQEEKRQEREKKRRRPWICTWMWGREPLSRPTGVGGALTLTASLCQSPWSGPEAVSTPREKQGRNRSLGEAAELAGFLPLIEAVGPSWANTSPCPHRLLC